MFGRADAPATDLAFFKTNRLDADAARLSAARRSVPPTDRPPTPVTWMDNVFQTRSLTRPQPHTDAARRLADGPDRRPSGNAGLPDPAHCLIAIREARIALAAKPDDTQAYRVLAGPTAR